MSMKRTNQTVLFFFSLLSWKQAARGQGSNLNLVTEGLLRQKILWSFANETLMLLQFERVWSRFTLFPRIFCKVSGYKLGRNFRVILNYSFYGGNLEALKALERMKRTLSPHYFLISSYHGDLWRCSALLGSSKTKSGNHLYLFGRSLFAFIISLFNLTVFSQRFWEISFL